MWVGPRDAVVLKEANLHVEKSPDAIVRGAHASKIAKRGAA